MTDGEKLIAWMLVMIFVVVSLLLLFVCLIGADIRDTVKEEIRRAVPWKEKKP